MTRNLSLMIPVVGALWVIFISLAIVLGRRRRADSSYRPATTLLIGLVLISFFAAAGSICLLLVSEAVPFERIVRVLLLVDPGLDTMMLRFGLISVYGITIFALISILRRRRS